MPTKRTGSGRCIDCGIKLPGYRKKCDDCKKVCPKCAGPTYIMSNGIAGCRPCDNEATRRYAATEHGKFMARIKVAMNKYGISRERAEELYASPCASCGQEADGSRENEIHIDHDHRTGRVRGPLCRGCNISLGLLKEDPSRILALYEYAKEM